MRLDRMAKLLNVPKLDACRRNESWFELNNTLFVKLYEQSGGRSISAEAGRTNLQQLAGLIRADVEILERYLGDIEEFLEEAEEERFEAAF